MTDTIGSSMERDFLGYGRTPPDPHWPNGARLALNFVVNIEEGSEPSVQDGEGYSERGLTEAALSNPGIEGRDLAAEGLFAYGSRAGFWRVMRLFEERGFPATMFACALALERNPAIAEYIRASQNDVCSHGWRWVKHYQLSSEEERDHIKRAIESLRRTIGERPLGWYCRYGPSVNTRRLLVEEGGFLYDSDAYDDDLPYWTKMNGHKHLVVPYSLTNNDGKFMRGEFATADDFFHFCRDAFDMLYREGAASPKMMTVGLHPRVIGHPGRAAGLERFLDHVKQHTGVWVTRRIDIARHWAEHHPATA